MIDKNLHRISEMEQTSKNPLGRLFSVFDEKKTVENLKTELEKRGHKPIIIFDLKYPDALTLEMPEENLNLIYQMELFA